MADRPGPARNPRIEHVALWVRELDATCAFYAEHFGATVGPLYENDAKGFRSRFLDFGGGARLEVMTTRAWSPVAVEPGAQRMGLAHLAIALGSEQAVDGLTASLRARGVPVLDGPRRTGDGYYESVVLDPEGNRIEITA
jgi:lactoylglutathione lyase